MESTVINQPQQPQPPQEHVGGDQHQHQPGQQQQHHQHVDNDEHRFRSGHNPFFFDMDDPHDFFTNPALRTRLSRFQNPWNSMFPQRKRRTSPPNTPSAAGGASAADPHAARDPYRDDFFQSHFDSPHWNEPRGWPMNGARMRMQDHIPEEFRHYMPEQFGFSHHHPPPPHPRQTSVPQSPQAQAHAHAQSAQPQQQYNQRTNSGDLRRPKFCDAGMQTDDVSPSESLNNINDQQHQQPHPEQQQQQQQREATPQTPAAEPQVNQQSSARSFADTGVGNSPNGSFASANAYASSNAGDGQRQTRSNSNSMGNVRRVPIIVEGQPSSLPKESYMPRAAAPPQPQQQKAPQRPPPPQAREVPIQRPVEPPSPSVVSINKIQDIQQDVLDLMFKVEQYSGGSKEDKEYKFLDEMLTRNLLKLDTIDTRGNDSIRLARKEAIKCIQASLSVLEAKVDGRAPAAEEAKEEEVATEAKENGEVAAEEEKKDEEPPKEDQQAAADEVDKSKIPIPMPGIPGQVPEPTIRDCNSDEEDDRPVYVSQKTVELKKNKE